MRRRGQSRFFLGLSVVPMLCLPCGAFACPLALIIAIDVSSSVDSEEYALQLKGLASAFRDEDVQAAILAYDDPIASTAFEWSGQYHQIVIADWAIFFDAESIERFATHFDEQKRTVLGQHTATGSAIAFANGLLDLGPDCSWNDIDVSSDGYNNEGPTPEQTYDLLDFSEVTVNALVISGDTRPVLKKYFETDVIHGPGAFALGTVDFSDYPEAIKKKLLRELTQQEVATAK